MIEYMHIEKLLSIASKALDVSAPDEDAHHFHELFKGTCADQLLKMLTTRNGFYAFEGALHVFPLKASNSSDSTYGLLEWNAGELWRNWYGETLDGLLFFAEDIFGGQFAINGEQIVSFDPESGELLPIATSLEGWAQRILLNYAEMTGYPVAHAWQVAHGEIPDKKRLLPKIPFILGGEYEVENLVAVSAEQAMKYRGELWQQLKDLPDGAQVRLNPIPSH